MKSGAINFRLNWYRKSISIIERSYIYIYIIYMSSSWHRILMTSLEIYMVGDNRRTVKTSTTPHISGQLGTKKSCKILLCWFIVMIWVLVCHNMYRYERHFGFFLSQSNNLETVSVVSKWVDTENRFYLNTTIGNNSSADVFLLR